MTVDYGAKKQHAGFIRPTNGDKIELLPDSTI